MAAVNVTGFEYAVIIASYLGNPPPPGCTKTVRVSQQQYDLCVEHYQKTGQET